MSKKINTVAIDLILFQLADKEEMHSILDLFGQVGRQTTELADLAYLEHTKIHPLGYNGENGVYSFS